MYELQESYSPTGLPLLSIKEMVDRTEEQRKEVGAMLDSGHYDHFEANIFRGQKKENHARLMETLRAVSLNKLIRRSAQEAGLKVKEFLARSPSGTGIAGAARLVPDKIYQVMFDSAVEADVCAEVSRVMIGADDIPGATLKVDIATDDSYQPKQFSSGAAMPSETIETKQATLDFKNFSINFPITNDLIEDSQFDLIEMHLSNAGREMGEYASNLCLTELASPQDGDGTTNTCTSAVNDTTKFYDVTGATDDIYDGISENSKDGFVSDTLVIPHHCMLHVGLQTAGVGAGNESPLWANFTTDGFPTKIGPLTVVYSNVDALTQKNHPTAGTRFTNCKTLVFAKDYACVTGRKRWLRIEKYSNPINDLSGAVVSARQDTVTLYKDAICVHTES